MLSCGFVYSGMCRANNQHPGVLLCSVSAAGRTADEAAGGGGAKAAFSSLTHLAKAGLVTRPLGPQTDRQTAEVLSCQETSSGSDLGYLNHICDIPNIM